MLGKAPLPLQACLWRGACPKQWEGVCVCASSGGAKRHARRFERPSTFTYCRRFVGIKNTTTKPDAVLYQRDGLLFGPCLRGTPIGENAGAYCHHQDNNASHTGIDSGPHFLGPALFSSPLQGFFQAKGTRKNPADGTTKTRLGQTTLPPSSRPSLFAPSPSACEGGVCTRQLKIARQRTPEVLASPVVRLSFLDPLFAHRCYENVHTPL